MRDLLSYSAFVCTCINIWNWINKMLTVSVVSVCYTPGHFKDTGKTKKHKERKVQPLHHCCFVSRQSFLISSSRWQSKTSCQIWALPGKNWWINSLCFPLIAVQTLVAYTILFFCDWQVLTRSISLILCLILRKNKWECISLKSPRGTQIPCTLEIIIRFFLKHSMILYFFLLLGYSKRRW